MHDVPLPFLSLLLTMQPRKKFGKCAILQCDFQFFIMFEEIKIMNLFYLCCKIIDGLCKTSRGYASQLILCRSQDQK